jgi:phosphatidate phosphatase APP1
MQKTVVRWATKINPFRHLKLWLKEKLGWVGIPIIIPYSGYGNTQTAIFIGCVAEDKGISSPNPQHSKWNNLLAMAKRFSSDELPGVRVRARFLGLEQIALSDDAGIFRFEFDLSLCPKPIPDEPWVEINLELLDDVCNHLGPVRAAGEILILKPNSSTFGVISDIDDTILVSHSTNVIKKLRLMLFKNAYTRLPFEGVAGFYRALNKGASGKCHNPIFYVSSSQWNLFDLLYDFCRFRNIPKGVFLLQELKPFKTLKKLIKPQSGIAKHAHKLDKIRSILTTFQYLDFVLIGDSGQKDAEIYRQVAMEFPGRILSIYIRDIRKSRVRKVMVIGTELNTEGIEMLLVKDTTLAAKHAVEVGLISPDCLYDVAYEKEYDHLAELEI